MSKSKLWCVAMRPEGDSPFRQTPAQSYLMALEAVGRYRRIEEKQGNIFFLEIFDDMIQVQRWHGTRKDHIRNMFYTADWFKKAMYQCFDIGMAERVFKFGEIVNCFKSVKHYKKGDSPFVTANFEEAKRFYEEAKADAEG
ncbi:hypothetical protein [Acinetobacter modestus]|uniref:hypothetical protein n=1 Tax=Acinetobacter modestus TaxID=1776740 RepID=UPI001F4B2195|nr:hypothetical protein [Acinetobacter modestus]MCH7328094.1 hypothetical protein [Acinetobacter modestus]